jgi:hypothetical protein
MFTVKELSVTAAERSWRGTTSGVIACQVGEFWAMPSPRANVKPIRVHGVIKPANATREKSGRGEHPALREE